MTPQTRLLDASTTQDDDESVPTRASPHRWWQASGVRYTRLYTDADGISRFEDLELDFTEADFGPPAPPVHISAPMPASAVLVLRADAGWTDPAHPAPARQLMVLAAGAAEITAGGETRRFEQGAIVLVEDTEGAGHATTILEDGHIVAVRLA